MFRAVLASLLWLLLTASIRFPPAAAWPGALVLDGGPEADSAVARRFVELAGGTHAKLVLIPTASTPGFAWDSVTAARYQALFGPACCTIVNAASREAANDPHVVAPLRTATGVWMIGGRTDALPDTYWHTATEAALRELLARGGVIGGSSAGAMVQGSRVATIHPERGLGLLGATLVMPHLNRHNALALLRQEVGRTPGLRGLGIPEHTAAVVRHDSITVLGADTVAVVAGSDTGLTVLRIPPGTIAQPFAVDH